MCSTRKILKKDFQMNKKTFFFKHFYLPGNMSNFSFLAAAEEIIFRTPQLVASAVYHFGYRPEP